MSPEKSLFGAGGPIDKVSGKLFNVLKGKPQGVAGMTDAEIVARPAKFADNVVLTDAGMQEAEARLNGLSDAQRAEMDRNR